MATDQTTIRATARERAAFRDRTRFADAVRRMDQVETVAAAEACRRHHGEAEELLMIIDLIFKGEEYAPQIDFA